MSLAFVALALLAASCTQTDKARPKIGLAMRSFDDSVSIVVRGTIETAALDRADLSIIDGQGQQSAQDKQTEAFFDKNVGAVAINPVDTASLGKIIDKAKAKKIPIVFFGLEPSDDSMRSWDKLFFIGTRRADKGAAQGEILASYWKATPTADRNKDGALQFVALTAAPTGLDEGSNADAAAKALNAAGIRTTMLGSETAAGGIAAAQQKAAALLAKYGDKIEAFICDDDETALGAADALKAAGYFKGKKHMPVVGAGEGEISEAIAAAIASGSLLGTAETDSAGQAKAVFDLAYALAKGAASWRSGLKITDAKYVWVPCKKITKDNLTAKK
jgi:methyl-galactoside transport system substrate-binding protein